MDAVWINFLYNPLIPIGMLLAVLAAFAFLLFLRGFLSGFLYLFTLNGNDEFLHPARVRVLWSFLLLLMLFCIWEFLRWVGSLFSGNPAPGGIGFAVFLFILLLIGVWGAKYMKKNTPP